MPATDTNPLFVSLTRQPSLRIFHVSRYSMALSDKLTSFFCKTISCTAPLCFHRSIQRVIFSFGFVLGFFSTSNSVAFNFDPLSFSLFVVRSSYTKKSHQFSNGQTLLNKRNTVLDLKSRKKQKDCQLLILFLFFQFFWLSCIFVIHLLLHLIVLNYPLSFSPRHNYNCIHFSKKKKKKKKQNLIYKQVQCLKIMFFSSSFLIHLFNLCTQIQTHAWASTAWYFYLPGKLRHNR